MFSSLSHVKPGVAAGQVRPYSRRVAPAPPRPTVELPRALVLGLGGALVGTGALSALAGGVALGLDGRCLDLSQSATGSTFRCEKLYSTSGLGIGLVTVGVAGLAAGITLLAWPPRPTDNQRGTRGKR